MQQGGAKNWLSQHEAEHPSHVSQAAPNCTTLQFSSSEQGPVCIGPHQGEKQKRRRGTRVAVESASAPFCSLVLRGTANAVPGGKDKKGSQGTCCRQPAASSPPVFVPAIQGYYEDDDVSLQELIRRERIEGVQARLTLPCRSESSRVFRVPLSSLLEDYDANLEKHILKRGDRFKMLEDDEDEALGLCLVLSPLPSPLLPSPPIPLSLLFLHLYLPLFSSSVCVCVCVFVWELVRVWQCRHMLLAGMRMPTRRWTPGSVHLRVTACGWTIGELHSLPGRVRRSDSSKRKTTRTGSRQRVRLLCCSKIFAVSRSIWKDALFAWRAMFSR